MKHAFVTTCLHGIAVALRTEGPSVRSLITCQHHPPATGHPLIQLGSQGDGCYLVPEDLEASQHAFRQAFTIERVFEVVSSSGASRAISMMALYTGLRLLFPWYTLPKSVSES
jgi:hypothetical protein